MTSTYIIYSYYTYMPIILHRGQRLYNYLNDTLVIDTWYMLYYKESIKYQISSNKDHARAYTTIQVVLKICFNFSMFDE